MPNEGYIQVRVNPGALLMIGVHLGALFMGLWIRDCNVSETPLRFEEGVSSETRVLRADFVGVERDRAQESRGSSTGLHRLRGEERRRQVPLPSSPSKTRSTRTWMRQGSELHDPDVHRVHRVRARRRASRQTIRGRSISEPRSSSTEEKKSFARTIANPHSVAEVAEMNWKKLGKTCREEKVRLCTMASPGRIKTLPRDMPGDEFRNFPAPAGLNHLRDPTALVPGSPGYPPRMDMMDMDTMNMMDTVDMGVVESVPLFVSIRYFFAPMSVGTEGSITASVSVLCLAMLHFSVGHPILDDSVSLRSKRSAMAAAEANPLPNPLHADPPRGRTRRHNFGIHRNGGELAGEKLRRKS
ncbi:unnamed protein product [Darwinula stevensoni]|uniref:Uncharacterized protein n=1 Tax=Darwinula stevensoni TaxID=69355 RepID=A0A7R9FRJ8_9CRUS|nr:unnamed protein product [Darwinula stevensoni]CAG0901417.1 unnamed protein product [Darwinula stevensoni]